MSGFSIRGFGGLIPRLAAQLLPDNAGTRADNLKTFGQSLASWRRGQVILSLSAVGVQSIYRMFSGVTDYWLESQSAVNYVLSPGSNDFRLFYTGEATPRKTNFALATVAPPYPTNYREMGIPAPATPVVAVGVAGAGSALTRNYIATYVTDWGEEGPPSGVSNDVVFNATGFTVNLSNLETGKKQVGSINRSGSTATANCVDHGFYNGSKVTIAGAVQPDYNGTFVIAVVDDDNFTYQVSGLPATPATGTISAAGNYGLAKMRLYRSLASSAGIVGYQLVKERSIVTGTDTDTVVDSALGAICPSFEMNGSIVLDGSQFVQPPADLHNIIIHPGNFAVGLSGKYLCFSEPDNLHAWPLRYRLALNYDGVGLGIVDSTVVVATTGKAEVVTGNHPLFMSKGTDQGSDPCSNGRGVASLTVGVLYPTPNGMQLIGVGGSSSAMDDFAKRDQWQARYFPDTIFAAIYQGAYFGFFNDGSRVRGFVFDRTNKLGPLTDLDYDVSAIYADPITATLYYVSGDELFEWEADDLNLSPFDWTGKEFVLKREVNIAAAQINADWAALAGDFAASQAQMALDQAYNAAILAGDPMAAIPPWASVTVYTLGQTVKLLDRELYCTVGGTSGGGAPSLVGKILNDNVTDNTVTWKLIWQVQSVERGCLNENGVGEFTLDGSLLRDTLWANYDSRSLLFQLYSHDESGVMVLRHQRFVTNGDVFKLPGGYLSHVYQTRLSGNIEVFSLKAATSVAELKEMA